MPSASQRSCSFRGRIALATLRATSGTRAPGFAAPRTDASGCAAAPHLPDWGRASRHELPAQHLPLLPTLCGDPGILPGLLREGAAILAADCDCYPKPEEMVAHSWRHSVAYSSQGSVVRINSQRITAPWTEYRKAIGGIFGGVFLAGTLFMGTIGGAGLLVAPLGVAGLYGAWAAVDAAVFLAVHLRDGEISFDARRFEARKISAVGVAPWQHMGKVPQKSGAAIFVIADGRRFFTPLCYLDESEATTMGQYLADYLSAEFVPQAFDVLVTTDFPGPSELGSRIIRSGAPWRRAGRPGHP
jgi:hypothetical protein